MLKIEDLKKALDTGDYGDCLCDYSGGNYISDAITEIADNHTSIYYTDIKEFIIENFEAVEDAINEFGWEGCGGDLYKAGQMAEFLTIQNDIYDNIEDCLKLYALNYIEHDCDYSEISEELANIIDNITDSDFDKFCEIEELIDNYFTGLEDEEIDN